MRKKRKPIQRLNNVSPIFVVVVVVILLIIGLSGRKHLSTTSINQVTNSTGTINLSMTPATNSSPLHTPTIITLHAESLHNHMTGIDAEIAYTNSCGTPTFTKGALFTNTLVSPKIENGKIKFVLAIAPDTQGITGSGAIGTISLNPTQPGECTLAFSNNTLTTSLESTTNDLHTASDATITFTDDSASPSPSAANSPEPSPSAELTASTSPIQSSSPSPSSATSQPHIPSAPSGLRSNCYSNGTRITLRWDTVTDADKYTVSFTQKNSDSTQTKDVTRPEIDFDLKPSTTYSWNVLAHEKDSLSAKTTISEVSCSADKTEVAATPTPSPSASAVIAATPSPTKKPLAAKIADVIKKTTTPLTRTSPTPSPTPVTHYDFTSPTATPGNLNDIFTSPTPTPSDTRISEPSIFSKIFLGWRALFYLFVKSLGQ